MIIKKYLLAATSPHALREFALDRSAFSTLAVNLLSGILILPIATLPLLDTVSIPLLLLIAVLFGPFIGVSVSFLYPRLEYWAGRRLGGNASFDKLYRIFAWSFMPVGPMSIASWLAIVFWQNRLGNLFLPVALAPLLIVLGFSVFSYCFNVIILHRLTKIKGAVSMFIALIFFIFIPAAIIVLLVLIVEAVIRYRARHDSNNDVTGGLYFTGFRKAVIAIFLFYALLFSGLVVYDEKLDPSVAKALATPLPDIYSPDNGWLALLTFTSQEWSPPFAKEQKRLRALQAAVLDGDHTGCNTAVTDQEEQDKLSFLGELPAFYTREKNGLREYALTHPAEVDRLVQDNAELLERYHRLYIYRMYTEPLDGGSCTPFPLISPIRNIQKVKFLHLAQLAQQGKLRDALLEVQKDGEFWRFVAKNSKTLISKLVSLAILTTDLQFVAELGTQPTPNRDDMQIIQTILRPFDQGETAFRSTLEGEAIFSLLAFQSIYHGDQKDPTMNSSLLKSNTTGNGIYSSFQQSIAWSEMTPREFAASVNLKEDTDSLIRNWSAIYNPVGEILNNIAQPNFARYINRGHRIECLRRLALLKILAGKENIKPEDMQRFLNGHRSDYGNPYTGEPMQWEAQKKRIFLKQADETNDVEIYL
jgi:hypothetical protein